MADLEMLFPLNFFMILEGVTFEDYCSFVATLATWCNFLSAKFQDGRQQTPYFECLRFP